MRVAIITTSYPAHDGDAAGHFVESEARALAAAGHEVVVLAPEGKSHRQSAQAEGAVRVIRLPAGSLFGWPGAMARLAAAPWRSLGGARFVIEARLALRALGSIDRIIAHWIVPSAFPIALGARPPLEVVAHGSDVELLVSLPAPARALVLRSLLRRGAEFRFVSEALRTRLAAVAPAGLSEQSHVAPCLVDVSRAAARDVARRQRGIAEDQRVVLIVGRLVPEKRMDVALGAALLVPRASVVVVGDGPERARLETAFSGARFVGQQPRPVTLGWLAAADVVVAASQREGAPTVVREARALGVPVVAAAAGDLAAWAERDPELYVVARP